MYTRAYSRKKKVLRGALTVPSTLDLAAAKRNANACSVREVAALTLLERVGGSGLAGQPAGVLFWTSRLWARALVEMPFPCVGRAG